MAGQFVFIDARVDDLDVLLGGLVPGVQVRPLDPDRDGLAQIAEALREADASGLSAVSIVAHGAPGRLEIGPAGLDAGALARQAGNLSALDAALAEDGVLRLYACETGLGADGALFSRALSAGIGGRTVAAASVLLGRGEPWLLDRFTPVTTQLAAPFTTDTQHAYRGTLAIRFTTEGTATFPSPQFLARYVQGDFDGDGDADALYQTGNDGSSFEYGRSNGNGTYTNVAQASSPFAGLTLPNIGTSNYRVGDFNGDGRDDLFVAINGTDGQLFLSNSNGTYAFQDTTGLSIISFNARTVAGDFNGDGRDDILYQVGNDGSEFRVGLATSSGTFTDATQASSPFAGLTLPNIGTSNYRVGDFNGDGRDDLFVAINGTDGQLFLSNSNGTYAFQDTTGLSNISFNARTVTGDFNSDGIDDILYQVGSDGSEFRVGLGTSSGTFTDAAQANSPFAGVTLAQIGTSNYRVGDIDGDGDIDLRVVVNSSTGAYYSQGTDTAGRDGNPPTLVSSNPADNATGVAPGANLTLTFDETVVKGTGNIEIVRLSDNVVVQTIAVTSGAVTVSGATVTIDPTSDLAGSTEYGLRIAAGAFRDLDGAIYAGSSNPSQRSFTTAAANTPPTQSANTGSTVAEGGTDTITSAELAFTDAQQGPGALTYTVTSAVANGTLLKSGSALGVGGTFTQADIAGGLITYTHNGGETTSDGFSFSVGDGAGGTASGSFSFTVNPVNDAPALTGTAAVLANGVENDPYTVTRAQLLQGWSDPENGTLALTTLSVDRGSIASSDGGLTYTITPEANYDGPVEISYSVGDGLASTPTSLAFTLANIVEGTAANDVLENTPGPDVFRGLGGSDTVSYDGSLGAVTASLLDPSQNTGAAEGDTYDGIENLRGGESDDTLSGDTGNNILDGGDGGDTITGNGGSDTASYARSDFSVTVDLDAGTASGGDAEDDVLIGIDNLLGSAQVDALTGNGNANVLDGNGGADTLTGLGGNDSYIVDEAGDQVIETAGNGNADAVYVRGNAAFTSYTLAAGLDIEVLATSRAISTRPLDLTGNEKDQTLYGNRGANVLDGGGGTDQMIGGDGADTFAFSTALGSDNVDRIVDFSAGDAIRLAKSVFTALDLGVLSADAFKDLSVSGASVDASDRILYDAKGRLFYDADGVGGEAAVLFARVSYIPTLTHDDFNVA